MTVACAFVLLIASMSADSSIQQVRRCFPTLDQCVGAKSSVKSMTGGASGVTVVIVCVPSNPSEKADFKKYGLLTNQSRTR